MWLKKRDHKKDEYLIDLVRFDQQADDDDVNIELNCSIMRDNPTNL